MKALYLWVLSLVLSFSMLAQSDFSPENFCANQQGRSKWLKQYQAHPEHFSKGGDTTIYVAMTVHLLGTDSGTGYYSEKNLLDAFCLLNESYEPAGIQFFLAGDILYHNNSAYYQHSSVLEGGQMMFEYNVPNTLNTYFVSDPAGNCGYNLPYAGIANAISCSGPNDITWSHEVGHGLSLPHPFLGWEGGVSWDGSVDHNFNDPAPTQVTYDYTYFQDTLILDTMIIDTTFVELVDGSNCTIAADGFCDTPPDYLASRWNCNGNGVSGTVQHDPADVAFQSDGSLIMNYANDACQNRFSEEQQSAMRAFLYDQRSQWISADPALAPVEQTATLISPIGGEIQQNFAAELTWSAVPNATQYLVQVSRLSSFPSALTDNYLTSGNSLIVDELSEDRTYFWRVRAFNNYHTCSEFTATESFELTFPVATTEINEMKEWRVYPQPVDGQQYLQVSWQMKAAWNGTLSFHNALGQTLWTQSLSLNSGQNNNQIELNDAPAGLYYLRLQSGSQHQVMRVMVE